VTEACGATQADAGVVGGSDCLSGTWKQYPNSCKSGGSSITLSFNGSTTTGRGAFTNPECTGQCDPIIFKYTYSVKGKTVTFDYDKTADRVTCSALGTTITPTPPQAPDVMDFSCSGGVLSTMTSLGNVDYKRP
jgi:hypothetical protein